MSKKIAIFDIETKKLTQRAMNEQELAQHNKDVQKAEAERLEAEQAEAEKQAKLESAKAKLTALGLDEAEVQAILGL